MFVLSGIYRDLFDGANYINLSPTPPKLTYTPSGRTWQDCALFFTLDYFLSNGFDVNSIDPLNGFTLLHYFAQLGGPLPFVRWLVKEKGANVEAKYESLCHLIVFSPYLFFPRDKMGNTPLRVALESQSLPFALCLVKELGADVNAAGRGKRTPISVVLTMFDALLYPSCTHCFHP